MFILMNLLLFSDRQDQDPGYKQQSGHTCEQEVKRWRAHGVLPGLISFALDVRPYRITPEISHDRRGIGHGVMVCEGVGLSLSWVHLICSGVLILKASLILQHKERYLVGVSLFVTRLSGFGLDSVFMGVFEVMLIPGIWLD